MNNINMVIIAAARSGIGVAVVYAIAQLEKASPNELTVRTTARDF